MIVWGTDRSWLMQGDCVEVLRGFADNTFDAIVCDPPYGLEFMGKEWDKLKVSDNPSGPQSEGWHDNGGTNPYARKATPRYAGKKLGPKAEEMQAQQAWHEAWAREALRVLKPGGHLVAFGGSRTYHRLACALEDAGFEIRDSLMFLHGQGFPKSLNLGDGRGTALKPAFEPIVLARKALDGTVVANVQKWGTGALNIDGCRIATTDNLNGGAYSPGVRPSGLPGDDARRGAGVFKGGEERVLAGQYSQPEGRWPANVVLDEEAGVMLDAQSGERRSAGDYPSDSTTRNGATSFGGKQGRLYADKGGASRFFYCPKTSRVERDAGLAHLPSKTATETVERDPDSAGARNPRAGAGRQAGAIKYRCAKCEKEIGGGRHAQACADGAPHEIVEERREGGVRNHHPTVKPVALMRWLVRMVTPPGGLVLDPFVGSGSTGIACVREGARFVGIDRETEYLSIAAGRIWHSMNTPEESE